MTPEQTTVASGTVVPLSRWTSSEPARVVRVHTRSEPEGGTPSALQPGDIVFVLDRKNNEMEVFSRGIRFRISEEEARKIQVRPADNVIRLSDLPDRMVARVVVLDPAVQGLSRRRLLDLGFTPGTLVQSDFPAMFGDPRAYRVRNSRVALRQDQAAHIWVEPMKDSSDQEKQRR